MATSDTWYHGAVSSQINEHCSTYWSPSVATPCCSAANQVHSPFRSSDQFIKFYLNIQIFHTNYYFYFRLMAGFPVNVGQPAGLLLHLFPKWTSGISGNGLFTGRTSLSTNHPRQSTEENNPNQWPGLILSQSPNGLITYVALLPLHHLNYRYSDDGAKYNT